MTGRWLCCPPAVLSGRSRTRTVSLFSVTVATAIRARLLAYRPCSCLGSGTQHPLRKSAWHRHPGPNYRLSPTHAQPEDKVSRPRAPAHSPDISREKGTRDVDIHGHEHGRRMDVLALIGTAEGQLQCLGTCWGMAGVGRELTPGESTLVCSGLYDCTPEPRPGPAWGLLSCFWSAQRWGQV